LVVVLSALAAVRTVDDARHPLADFWIEFEIEDELLPARRDPEERPVILG